MTLGGIATSENMDLITPQTSLDMEWSKQVQRLPKSSNAPRSSKSLRQLTQSQKHAIAISTMGEMLNEQEKAQLAKVMTPFIGTVLVDQLEIEDPPIDCPPLLVPLKKDENGEPVKWSGVPYARKYSEEQKNFLRQWQTKMINAGIIKKVTDPPPHATSPVHVVKDPSGKLRVTQDGSELNLLFEKVEGTIPLIRDICLRYGQHKFRGKLDMVMAYFQAPAHPSMRVLWRFRSFDGVYEYMDRLPMGDANVAQHFVSTLVEIFDSNLNVDIYFDDVLVYAHTAKEFINGIQTTLETCARKNIKCSIAKCCFGNRETDALGFVFSEKGMRPRDRMTSKFLSLEYPKTKKLLKQWLGLLNCFSAFSVEIKDIRAAFTESLKNGSKVEETPETRRAFERSRELMASLPLLTYVREDAELFLDTDASVAGTGAILYHRDEEQQICPIRMDSQVFSETAKKWPTYKQEAYAIIRALHAFEYLLRGRHFTIRTDHRNLLWISKMFSPLKAAVPPSWHPFLSSFNFRIVHIAGVDNVVADSLSRVFALNTINIPDTLIAEGDHSTDKSTARTVDGTNNTNDEDKEIDGTNNTNDEDKESNETNNTNDEDKEIDGTNNTNDEDKESEET